MNEENKKIPEEFTNESNTNNSTNTEGFLSEEEARKEAIMNNKLWNQGNEWLNDYKDTPKKTTDKIICKVIEDEMKQAYVDYAMSVIVGRALPDVRDGLKPVHRRILFAMNEMGMFHNKPYKKCARIVGEVLGKYHPHGDTAVYDSLVRMAQPFSLRHPLINGQGNFGSIDGDRAAAMRYCITGDSLILTNKGILPIKSISNKTEAKIDIKILSYNGKKNRTNKFFNSGKHKIVELMTKQDYNLKGSLNHPVLCWILNEFGMPNMGWKLLNEITPNDYVIINRQSSLFSQTNPSLISYFPKFSAKQKKITLPKTINNSLAFLLGALVAEGSFHQNKIIFNNLDRIFYNKVKTSILDNFPETRVYEREIKGNCIELDLYHQQIVHFLINLGLKKVKSDLKEIPHIVLSSKKEIIKQFLIALFEGDGSIQHLTDKRHQGKSIQLYYESKSKKLIHQLKVVLLNFGIITASPYQDKRNGCYRLIIPGAENINKFRKEIGFYSKRKKETLAFVEKINKNRMSKIDCIPFLNNYLRTNYSSPFIKKNNFDHYNNLKKNYSKLIKILKPIDTKLINWLLENKYFFDKVKEIKQLKQKEEVFSVKVDSSCHSFVANGFINHNTESKLNKLAEEMLQDIDKNTVEWKPNFDDSLKEPTVLPSKIPNLLINGSSGIAVGMATNIPPHNLREICQGTIQVIDNPDISVTELMKTIPGPDFPTGGEVTAGENLSWAYHKGRGKVIIKSVAEIEERKIIIKEVPYQVNKSELIEQIADLVRDKKVAGIRNINDESDREGIRVVIDLKKDVDGQVVLNQLFKYSRLKVTFGINLLALVNNEPKTLGLKELIQHHISHRQEIIRKRTQYDLEQAEKRIHILDGLIIALDNIETVIPGIRKSRTVDEAKEFLMGNYDLTEIQAKAILEMKLQKLASLEQEKIKTEHQGLMIKIEGYKEILGSESKILQIIKTELTEVMENYGNDRRSKIIVGEDQGYVDMEELIEKETVVVTITHSGYAKRIPLDNYRTQRRGGRGIKATGMKEEDVVEHLFITSTHTNLLLFTDSGQVHWLKAYMLPEGSRIARGSHLANLLGIKDERITAVVPVECFEKGYLFMGTEKGTVKKTDLLDFSNPRKGGIRALGLAEGDKLIGVRLTDGSQQIILASKKGMAVRFKESDVRPMGRTAFGVRGIRLGVGDKVVGMIVAEEGKNILTITEKGYGKRTAIEEYRLIGRGGKGVTNIKVVEKKGPVAYVMLVDGEEELMLISKSGIAIRMNCGDISKIGRSTQGVRVMRLDEGDEVVTAAKIVEEDEEETLENEE